MAIKIRPYIGAKSPNAKVRPSAQAYVAAIHVQMQAIQKNLELLVNSIEEATPEVLEAALRPTFELSQYYCPVDTGKMKASGYLVVRSRKGKIEAEIGYGKGGRPHYTVYQHENLAFFHKEPTSAKWLQRAIQEDGNNLQPRIIAGLKQVTGL